MQLGTTAMPVRPAMNTTITDAKPDPHDGLVRIHADGITIRVRAKPRSSRSAVLGMEHHDGRTALIVAIAAPPVDGAANAELTRTLARAMDVRRGAVAVVNGETGRTKLLHVIGDAAVLGARLAALISAFQDRR